MAQKTIDQIATDNPIVSLTGAELFIISATGITKGGALSILKNWIYDGIPTANATDPGFMTAAHFAKVDGLASVASTGDYADLSGTPGNATTSVPGLMSDTDKTKLDGLSNYTLPAATKTVIGGLKQIFLEDPYAAGTDVAVVEQKFNDLITALIDADILTSI